MLVLNTVNQSIQIVLAGAKTTTNPSYVSTYADNDGTLFTEGEKNGALNGTSPVTVVGSPGASTRRIIKEIVVFNEDSVPITLTVSLLDTGTTRNLVRKILVAGDYWKWTERVVGEKGDKGDIGLEPTIAVGAVSAVAYGVPPTVTNVGTPVAAIFDFQLETGPTGLTGATGANGIGAPVDAGGTPDAITATYSPPVTLVDHQLCLFVASGANTTTTPTFAPNGLAAHVITKKGGSALAAGDIPAQYAVCILEYNLANTRWELLNPAVAASAGGGLDLANNLKFVVNASVNKLDVFTKSGGAVPDGTNYPTISIPDGTGYTQRTRKATYLSGTSQFVMADAANYWSKGSLDAEIKTAYIYAIWDANGGIVWALGGYSGFTRCPASTTATDDDFFLLEASSTYTKVITDYCVCVGKIRYQYDTADTPDHTIQATVLDAPQVIWNPKSDYGKLVTLATGLSSGSDIAETALINAVVKQSGKYAIYGIVYGATAGALSNIHSMIKTGSSTYASATLKAGGNLNLDVAGSSSLAPVDAVVNLNVGDSIHLGGSVTGASGTRYLLGDNWGGGAPYFSHFTFNRID